MGQLGLSQLGTVYFQNVYVICFVFCTCIITQTESKISIKQLQLSSLFWGMHLPLNCHEPGYQTKVFTLCQSLTPISCKQGNYRFLIIELVKRHIDRTKHYSLKFLLNIFIYKRHQILLFLMKKAGKRVGNIGYNRAKLTRADLTQADLTRGRVDPIFTSEGFVVSTFRQTLRLTTLKIYY